PAQNRKKCVKKRRRPGGRLPGSGSAPLLGKLFEHLAGTRPASRRNGENRHVRVEDAAARIAELALSFPHAYEDRPFGDFPAYKVPPNKLFALAPSEEGAVLLTLKVTPEE